MLVHDRITELKNTPKYPYTDWDSDLRAESSIDLKYYPP